MKEIIVHKDCKHWSAPCKYGTCETCTAYEKVKKNE